jgi:hypothetical protein
MKSFLIFIILIFAYNIVFSQGEIQQTRMYNRDARTFAILVKSDGTGLNYRYGKRIDGYRKNLYGITLSSIKSSKETKTQNPYLTNTNKKFVFGKTNTVINLQLAYGRQKELFGKFDKGGIAIRYFYNLGPSLTMLKPIYYDIIDSIYYNISTGDLYMATSKKKFNTSVHQVSDIKSKSSFFDGISETKFVPGLYLELGLSIEYSNDDTRIRALEAGVNINAFSKSIQIMATDKNNWIIISLFLSYRFGKITKTTIN